VADGAGRLRRRVTWHRLCVRRPTAGPGAALATGASASAAPRTWATERAPLRARLWSARPAAPPPPGWQVMALQCRVFVVSCQFFHLPHVTSREISSQSTNSRRVATCNRVSIRGSFLARKWAQFYCLSWDDCPPVVGRWEAGQHQMRAGDDLILGTPSWYCALQSDATCTPGASRAVAMSV
jgi:hypothetical protein